jgi:glycerol-3-phosphate acyltransferase PlsY
LSLYAGAGAILGHNFPFYLKFKGGKGIAATAGLILAFSWPFVAVEAPLFLIVLLTTHYVSLGSLLVYIAFMAELVLLGQNGHFGMTQPHLYEMYVLGAFLTIMAFWKHRENIKRLLAGTERKTYLTKKNKED